ncbi:MAG: thioredoxin domain-containing protein [Gemmatimonadetes bacterium]|nr:thioredoxin domain-containing protein [Gemmatimonadota bacterium]
MSEGTTAQNRLYKETSPYLLQHASNPVDWYPWSEEAFDRARNEDKPIFLSVGYSACHWCHVMEHESFEDEEIAELMNTHYINIKVDREERPDVDEIYMNAVQIMTQQGGWPMSVFLTPEGKPFYGGTYFPPGNGYGRPGFRQVLLSIADFYKTRRDEVDRAIDGLMEGLNRIATLPGDGSELDLDLISQTASVLAQSFDDRDGGFGSQPKFPNSMSLEVFLRNYARTGQPEDLARVTMTLDRMARGGIYDQLGGGFHRYSVDHKWLVPHFEKMLYDNALLARIYLQVHQITNEESFLLIGTEILDYVLREMTSEEGGFLSTQDADSEGEEGRFFVWTPDEIREILGDSDGYVFSTAFDVRDIGNFEGKSILNRPVDLNEVSALVDLSVEEVEAVVEASRPRLLEARSKRVWPGRDDKVQVSWNGLMISAMTVGYQVSGDRKYLDAAGRAASFILAQMVQPDGRLLHSYKDGSVSNNAYLDDYGGLINALIDLYESTFDETWLERATQLADTTISQFWDDEGDSFFYTGIDHEALIVRSKNPYDNATPSGNSLTALAFIRLGTLLRRDDYTSIAERTIRRFQPYMLETPNGFAQMICAADYVLGGPVEVIVTEGEGKEEMIRAINDNWVPCRVLASGPAVKVPMTKERERTNAGAAVYVCQNRACSLPIQEPSKLASFLRPGMPR